MIRIGIATPFRVANYGTKLQAYAISEYLRIVGGGEAEIINFSPSDDHRLHVLLRKIFSIKRNRARLHKLISKRDVRKTVDGKKQAERIRSINAFDSILPLSKKISSWAELEKASAQYDCVVCGSDQIWLPDNLKDHYYTLEFCNGKTKRGSYAASLGVEVLNEKQKKAYQSFLKNLDFISVREDIGRDLLKSFFNEKEITWVCDPTFLLTQQQWSKVEKRPTFLNNVPKEYVFCYFLGTNEEHRQIVYDYAKKNGLSILSVANFKGFCEADTELTDVQLYDLTVNEFLYLIHNAEMVCTDSMHATIFSIIFETNFVTFERFKKSDQDSRNSRIYSLLQVMGLENRLHTDGAIPEEKIEFEKVAKAREAYVDFSKNYIMEEIV